MKKVSHRAEDAIHPADREEPKDFIERVGQENSFRRFVWSLWFVHLLERRGLQDISVSYAEEERRWYFEMRQGHFKLQHQHSLKWAMKVDACKLYRKLREDSFEVLVKGDSIWGTFIADHWSEVQESSTEA